ncbi:hypothetical protein GCM10009594_19940 [Kocuria palustris]|uniref:TetR/AcrR family transcriptional regulator n=1 Tax=Kocuria palustris TaxID=71999 RepID=UPI00195EC63D|nr:TetR/AcrR family transcriptional regulator [Kocuria palustris]MBM7823855.1 AcrR family transcriptional regulator [Kocuria palustris]
MDATTSGAAPELPAAAQRLRASALRLYARQGPTGTGVREIAADAGAAPGLIRHHFGSKAGLTRAVDDLVLSVIAQTLETATAQAGPSDTAAAVGAARDEAFARMLREYPEIAGYLRWCLIAPVWNDPTGSEPAAHDDEHRPSARTHFAREAAPAEDGLAERLVDFTLSEARRLRRAGTSSRDLRTSVLSTLLRQIGSMVVQPLTDRLWQRLEPAADHAAHDAPAPQVRIAMPSEEPTAQG